MKKITPGNFPPRAGVTTWQGQSPSRVRIVTCSFGINCSSVVHSNKLLRSNHDRKRAGWKQLPPTRIFIQIGIAVPEHRGLSIGRPAWARRYSLAIDEG
jgi:hypothetical protein